MKLRPWLIISLALAGGIAVVLARRRNRATPARPNQAIYRFYAPIYDRLFGRFYENARLRSAALLQLQPGEQLLISGVGTGLDLPLIPAGVCATGVDISAEMLAQARRKPCAAKLHLLQGDAQKLELPADYFDAALLSLIASVAPDGAAVFREAWRTLKPGGRMVIFDKFAPESRLLSPARRLAGSLIRLAGTDVNRRLSEIIGGIPGQAIVLNEASFFGGQYRLIKLVKTRRE